MRVLNGSIVWLGGEMEIPIDSTLTEAYHKALQIASACGYVVRWARGGRTALEISGQDINGYFVLEWFEPDRRGIQKVEHWTCTATYLDNLDPKKGDCNHATL